MRTSFILYLALFSFFSGCASSNEWTTRYSGKNDDKNEITLNLAHEGAGTLGPCGVTGRRLATYWTRLSPIKHEYKDAEIKLTQVVERNVSNPLLDDPFVRIAGIRGTIRFNEDFTKVDIRIQIPDANGRLTDFGGNGVHDFER